MDASIRELIEKIRKEEREKLIEEMKSKEESVKPHHYISDVIEDWGKENDIYAWHLCKIKNAVYTIIRYSLDMKHVADLRKEQTPIAKEIADSILEMIHPVN
ncbi:hypothetical protein EUAN_09070 [Andreesenia angusta]|uniref:Uncharacterized protein n=1 Tax=Andreesenia angusta TaxID=39480 RepID=A0A1S1V934_9FIRM|nr:hypothetical protein [Andreesenia angusta]OHW63123.1 hypothetical protein EUAN_09070 [Andreesenia angusta]